jgi:A/G-specific adenine glycosylase
VIANVAPSPAGFAERLIAWQARHGRQDLPWQKTRDPYRVWLSEIMLQQTQVTTVLDYYARFLARFPTVEALAQAALEDVMPLWAGLGYYARARNLHACAQTVCARHGGTFPPSASALAELPGIGPSTAAAIAAFCFDERAAILDGNVKRVLARHFAVEGDPAGAAVERRLWSLARELLPTHARDMPAYTQAVMDLGATLCMRSRPRCPDCPVQVTCMAYREDRVEELPTPRARSEVKLRQTHMLVLLHADQVLLQQRPPSGLWGGLLTPPQFDTSDALHAAVMQWTGAVRPAQALPPRRHAFTHFTLEFVPHVVTLPATAVHAGDAALCWRPLAQASGLAVPAPVRTLLRDVLTALREDAGSQPPT